MGTNDCHSYYHDTVAYHDQVARGTREIKLYIVSIPGEATSPGERSRTVKKFAPWNPTAPANWKRGLLGTGRNASRTAWKATTASSGEINFSKATWLLTFEFIRASYSS